MVVLMDNCILGVRRRKVAEGRDSYGDRVASGWGPVTGGVLPGRRNEQADGMWALAVDPSLWPVRQDDLVISTDGATWLVATSDLIQNSEDDYVNYVRLSARLRSQGGTEPGDAWFVARYSPVLDDVPATPGDPVRDASGLWMGYGVPTEPWPGVSDGEEYMDLTTGAVYVYGAP